MGMQRRSTNKRRDARRFNHNERRTHRFNVSIQRGGFRL